MFGWFKGKTEEEKLTIRYKALLQESYDLSTTDRAASDIKRSEAEELGKKIEELRKDK